MKLPQPSVEASDHQQRLFDYLQKQYQLKQHLSFAEFMQIALYAPGLGYYSAGMTKLGKDGDFVTAPEISPLFSQCIANQCAEIFAELNSLSVILELGAGTGRMATDLLLHLKAQQSLPKQYWILEVSADLRQRQQALLKQALPDYYPHIKWLDRIPTEKFNGIILANEVLDAMAVELFQISDSGLLQAHVKPVNEGWTIDYSTAADDLTQAVQKLQQRLPEPLPVGYTSEINLGMSSLIRSLNAVLEKGVMLFIDYGFPSHEYYHPSRHMGTLMCHYRHYAHSDPMQYIGLQDITAHVDFTALALAGRENGLDLLGYTHQAGFLLDCGLLELSHRDDITQQVQISQQIQRLTQPHEMGELFKVMALGKKCDLYLDGFQSFEASHRLMVV